MNTQLIVKSLGTTALVALAGLAIAGPLDPPVGPVAPSFKTLQQVEPRTPLSATTTPGDADSMFRITVPGSYYLEGNLGVTAGKHGIEIAANSVTIDLNGFRISSAGSGSGLYCGIISTSTQLLGGMTSITIRNGSVVGFQDAGVRLGVLTQLDRAKGGLIENLALRSNNIGVVAGDGFALSHVVAENNSNTGISVYDGCSLTHCVSRSNEQSGFASGGGAVFADCSATGNGATGFGLSVRASLSNCVAESNGGDGFSLGSSGVAADCVASGNGDDGFTAAASTLRNCTAQSNDGDGFQLSSSSVLRDSLARINTGFGIRVTFGDCRIDSNHVASNTTGGIELGSTTRNIVLSNSLVGHTAGTSWGSSTANNSYGQGSLENIVWQN